MAYMYQISFDIRADQMNELEIGAALRRVLGYLRTLLPNERGYITARALVSLDGGDNRQLVFESVWQTWSDIQAHQRSQLVEHKVLTEFQPHVQLEHMTIHTYDEVE